MQTGITQPEPWEDKNQDILAQVFPKWQVGDVDLIDVA